MSELREEYHGGIDFDELSRVGVSSETILDFSSNVMPFGVPERVVQSVANAVMDRYPDREGTRLRMAIAKYHSVPVNRVILGNGCSELIHWTASCMIRRDDRVLILDPTFSEYARASAIAGGQLISARAIPGLANDAETELEATTALLGPNWGMTREQLSLALELAQPSVVWICNPNNPTGQYLDNTVLDQLVRSFSNVRFIVDESYIDFVANSTSMIASCLENVIVLRSMTKYYALAGLRLGYAIALESTIEQIVRRRVPWTVNACALAAGEAALECSREYEQARSQLLENRDGLMESLREMGYSPQPTDTGYFLLPMTDSAGVRSKLLRRGILVRDCASFGLKDVLRIATNKRAYNQRFLDTLGECQ